MQDFVHGYEIEAVSQEKTLSIYNLIMDGGLGGQLIITLLFILLAVALYIYFERVFAIKAASNVDKNFMNQIKDHITNGKLESAKTLCANTPTPTARLIGKGISRMGHNSLRRRENTDCGGRRIYHAVFC